MKNHTDHEQSQMAFFGKMRQKLQERKHRVRRLIELKRLRRIRKQTIPGYTHCKNCGTKLEGMYCHCCGQYALDIYQPFWKYLKQYIENVYQFDSKIWQTLRLMFTRPGFLTNEFNAGKINSYMHPFRLYMCISVVFFTLLFMLASDKANEALQENLHSFNIDDHIVEQLKSENLTADTVVYMYHADKLISKLEEAGVDRTPQLIQARQLDNRFSLSYVRMPRLLLNSCLHQTTIKENDLQMIKELQNLQTHMSGLEAVELDVIQSFQLDSAGRAHTPVYSWGEEKEKTSDVNKLRSQTFLNDLLGNLSKWTPLYMMFLLPLFAGLLKLGFRKSNFPYMWHFVHAIHLNTVFLILIPIPLIPVLFGDSDFTEASQNSFALYSSIIFTLGMCLYTYLSLHTVYRRSWGVTLLKTIQFLFIFSLIAIGIAVTLLVLLLVVLAEQYEYY